MPLLEHGVEDCSPQITRAFQIPFNGLHTYMARMRSSMSELTTLAFEPPNPGLQIDSSTLLSHAGPYEAPEVKQGFGTNGSSYSKTSSISKVFVYLQYFFTSSHLTSLCLKCGFEFYPRLCSAMNDTHSRTTAHMAPQTLCMHLYPPAVPVHSYSTTTAYTRKLASPHPSL